jgi:hypothetical protein
VPHAAAQSAVGAAQACAGAAVGDTIHTVPAPHAPAQLASLRAITLIVQSLSPGVAVVARANRNSVPSAPAAPGTLVAKYAIAGVRADVDRSVVFDGHRAELAFGFFNRKLQRCVVAVVIRNTRFALIQRSAGPPTDVGTRICHAAAIRRRIVHRRTLRHTINRIQGAGLVGCNIRHHQVAINYVVGRCDRARTVGGNRVVAT